jgi:hypothetical protein
VQFTGNHGTLTGNGTITQPFLIFDYRLTTPSSWGLHLYYGPFLPASGLSNSAQSTASGVWGGEITYDWVLHLTERALLIVEPYAGYGQTTVNTSVTTALGNTVTSNTSYTGVDLGINLIFPLSEHLAIVGTGTWYPWSTANFNVTAPAVGLTGSASASAPQSLYGVSVVYRTSNLWNFSIGYQWYSASIGAVPFSTMTAGGETIGGAFCPCNSQFSGFTFSVGKTF